MIAVSEASVLSTDIVGGCAVRPVWAGAVVGSTLRASHLGFFVVELTLKKSVEEVAYFEGLQAGRSFESFEIFGSSCGDVKAVVGG